MKSLMLGTRAPAWLLSFDVSLKGGGQFKTLARPSAEDLELSEGWLLEAQIDIQFPSTKLLSSCHLSNAPWNLRSSEPFHKDANHGVSLNMFKPSWCESLHSSIPTVWQISRVLVGVGNAGKFGQIDSVK